ncbi:MAG: mechanosensitive ion channel family protein [Candidatus Bathyarchaeia archaeon]
MSEDWSKRGSRNVLKVVAYAIALAFALSAASLAFEMVPLIKPYGVYLPYIQAALVFLLGYKVVVSLSQAIYYSMRKISDHPTAATTRTITKIAGIAVLLSFLASIFGVSASAALTVGSFSGLVVGFATQTVLKHAIAGIFIALSRPFKHGDLITVAGQTGTVKGISLMHTTLESQQGDKEILIPSGKIIGEIIARSSGAEKKSDS